LVSDTAGLVFNSLDYTNWNYFLRNVVVLLMMKLPERYDDCVMGYGSKAGAEDCLIYDVDSVLQILMEDMTYDEAFEYFEYNIAGAYVGETTPIFLWPKTMKEIEDEV
tara:strand:- start:372 stop:695 length:324 start_codon:yes stop_codon:yes gene_type:complete